MTRVIVYKLPWKLSNEVVTEYAFFNYNLNALTLIGEYPGSIVIMT